MSSSKSNGAVSAGDETSNGAPGGSRGARGVEAKDAPEKERAKEAGVPRAPAPPKSSLVGSALPKEVDFLNIESGEFETGLMALLLNKRPTVVCFYVSWCPSCVAASKMIEA